MQQQATSVKVHRLSIKTMKSATKFLVGAAFAFTGASALPQASVDLANPVDANGKPIPQSLSTSGDNMCWGDVSDDGRIITSDFGAIRKEGSSPHAGVDFRAYDGSPVYSVADGCVSFGNPTPKQLVGVKIRINDKLPNSSVWYLHLSRVVPKFVNDGRAGQCIPVKKGELVGYSGNHFGTRGNVVTSGAAHLHLSYYASGLMLNPAPFLGAPANVPAEYNTIKDGSSLQGGNGSVNDSNASGTRGSKLGFAIPRMCNIYTVNKYGQPKTIPYNSQFGIGNFNANASAPTQSSLADGAQRIKQSMGVDGSGAAPADTVIDADNWLGGVPEAPDWESYADMSFHQIIQAEVSRRNANSRWHEELTRLSARGLQLEEMRIQAFRLAVQHELFVVKQRTETMMASILAAEARLARPTPPRELGARSSSPLN